MRTTKFAALVAAVALLVVGAAFASFAATGWVPEGDDWYYYDKEDVMADSCWRESNGGWYWLNESGVMEKEAFVEWKEKTFYVNETGLMVTGWQKIYDEDDDADYWYFFQDNGAAYCDTKKECPTADGTHTYIFDENCRMISGWADYNSKLSPKTASYENTEYESANYYCGDENDGAVVLADWRYLNIAGEDEDDDFYWFYFKSSGKKAVKAETIGNKRYDFDPDGKMRTDWNATPSEEGTKSFYAADGAQVTSGWFEAYDNMDPDEENDDLYWYYAESKTAIAKRKFIVDGGKLYLLDKDGKLVSGFAKVTFKEATKSNKNVDVVTKIDADEDGDYSSTALEAGEGYLYYFNEEHDGTFGSMKTGVVTVSLDGEDTEFKFTTGSKIVKDAGVAVDGFDGAYYYTMGQKLTADDDYKYYAVVIDQEKSTMVDTEKGIKKLDNVVLTGDPVPAYKINGYERTTTKDAVVMTSKGNFIKQLSKKDDDDYKWVVKDYILQSVKLIED